MAVQRAAVPAKTMPIPRLSIETAVATIASYVRREDLQPNVEAALQAIEAYVDQPLKIGEVQKRLGVKSPTTIHKWVDIGRFPNAYQVNGQLRVPAHDVDDVRQAAQTAGAKSMLPPAPIGEFEGDPLEELI